MVVFDPPGPGMWELDRSHYPGGTTPIAQWLVGGMSTGSARAFAAIGMPAERLDVKFVNGFLYTRLRPLIAPDRASTKLPPLPILRLAARLHPGMRRRADRAQAALSERLWRDVAGEWHASIRPGLEKENAELQAVDVTTLDDGALIDHIDRMLTACRDKSDLHFYLHIFDLGPIGFLLAECAGWGIEADEVIPALAGASPSTSAPARALEELRSHVAGLDPRPSTLAELRAVSRAVAGLLDSYLAQRGRMMVTRYDLDGATLEEQPAVVLATVFDGIDRAPDPAALDALIAGLRARVPAADRGVFDERLTEARAAMDMRDDNAPNTIGLPVGILRFALLELGHRLASAGRLHDARHILEIAPSEIRTPPSADELADRSARRAEQAGLDPPPQLGPTEVRPPLHILSAPHRTMIAAVDGVLTHLGMSGQDRGRPPLRGSGVGASPYEGTARVAASPEDAVGSMEAGDVLVVGFTTPAYNTILGLAGAVVTAEGALLSHAAVMARELGIPAVIGAAGALRDIPDGARVRVNPTAGTVEVLSD